jgi:1-carboxybiuret hydrolase subunit AtzG-like protein
MRHKASRTTNRKPKSVRARRPAKPPRTSRALAKAKPADAIDMLVKANATALGLTLDPAWHEAIAFNLRLIMRHAALVEGFALPDDAEPAQVFRA